MSVISSPESGLHQGHTYILNVCNVGSYIPKIFEVNEYTFNKLVQKVLLYWQVVLSHLFKNGLRINGERFNAPLLCRRLYKYTISVIVWIMQVLCTS